MTGTTIRRTLSICALAIGLAIVAAPASAQTGPSRARSSMQQGNPVDGAKITLENQRRRPQASTTKSNKKGEYIQVGLHARQVQGHRVEGRPEPGEERRHPPRHGQRSTSSSAPGGAAAAAPMSKEEAAKAEGEGRRHEQGVRGRRRAQQGRQERRGDREVQRGHRRRCRTAPSATTTSAPFRRRRRRTTTRRKPPTRRRSS